MLVGRQRGSKLLVAEAMLVDAGVFRLLPTLGVLGHTPNPRIHSNQSPEAIQQKLALVGQGTGQHSDFGKQSDHLPDSLKRQGSGVGRC